MIGYDIKRVYMRLGVLDGHYWRKNDKTALFPSSGEIRIHSSLSDKLAEEDTSE